MKVAEFDLEIYHRLEEVHLCFSLPSSICPLLTLVYDPQLMRDTNDLISKSWEGVIEGGRLIAY